MGVLRATPTMDQGVFVGLCRLEAAVQRLTSLCSVLNEMEPLRVLNHMFVPREVTSVSEISLYIYPCCILILSSAI